MEKPANHMTARDPAGKRSITISFSKAIRRVVCPTPGTRSTTIQDERPSRVTIEIMPLKDQVRLTVVHEDFDEGSLVLEKISKGWPSVLSSLKTYLETGRSFAASSRIATAAAEAGA